MTLDDFLGHKPNEGGSDNVFLRWNKRNPPQVDVWLHTGAPIMSLWQHGWQRIVDRTDKESGQTRQEIWGDKFNCWEPEAVLKRQYFRDKQTGLRKTPPTICPHCLVLEMIRQAVDAGRLSWVAPLFVFEAGQNSQVLHAGGLYNAYKKNDLSQEELAELRAANIYRKEAWKENGMARCSYVFRVVDNDAPQDGIQISTEGTGLGDKVKAAIHARMTARGREEGNPLLSPCAIRWEHHPNAEKIDDRYRAIMMDRIMLTEDIRKLIVDEPPPDVSRLVAPGNPTKLRASMEGHYVGPEGLIDWDAAFSRAEKVFAEQEVEAEEDGEAEDPTSFDYGANVEEPAQGARVPEVREPAKAAVKAQPATASKPQQAEPAGIEVPEGDELVSCDVCGKPMLMSQTTCPSCGKVYEEEEPEPAPPPPPKRSRSAAKKPAPAKAASQAVGQPARVAPPNADQNADWGIGPDEAKDGAPF